MWLNSKPSSFFHFLAFIHSPLLPKCFSDLSHWPSHPHATGVAVHPALFVNEVKFSFTEMGKKTLKELGLWLKEMVIHCVHTWDHEKWIRLWMFMYSTPTNIFEQVFGTFRIFWWHFTSHVMPGRKISACVIFTPLFTEQYIWSHGSKIVKND